MSHQWVDNLSAMLQNQDEPQVRVRLTVKILEQSNVSENYSTCYCSAAPANRLANLWVRRETYL
jgi:hypothetical protein